MAGTSLEVLRGRITQNATRMTTAQKAMLAAAFVATLGGLLFLSRMGGEQKMAVLYADLDPAAAASVVDALSGQGVPYELSGGGRTVEVPVDALYETRLALSAEGLPEVGGGWSILDDQGITTSEFDQRVGYQRAMEGELARTIGVIQGVERANVHLVMPRSDLFVKDDTMASASVLLQLKPGAELGAGQVQSIVNLVASSVEGLTPKAITVTDNLGRSLAAPGSSMSSTLEGEQRVAQREAYERSVASRLEAMLAKVVGPGNAMVAIAADLDFDSVVTTQEEYRDPNREDGGRTVAGATTRLEEYTGANPGAAGVLGAEAEVVEGEQQGGDGTNYRLDEQDTSYALDKTVTNTERAPGAVRSMSVSVLVDEAVVGPGQIPNLETMVEAATGIDTERGDTVAVTRLPFDTSYAEAIASDLDAAAKAESTSQLIGLIRTGGTVLLALVVLVVGILLVRRGRKTVVSSIDLDELAALQPAALEPAAAAGEIPSAPARTVDDLASLIKNQPDDVAALLRTWMQPTGAAR